MNRWRIDNELDRRYKTKAKRLVRNKLLLGCNGGSFIGADYFDGESWAEDLPVVHYSGPYETEDQADEFGDKNDISF